MDAFITANEFKVKYKQSNDTITIRARNAFTFNISELIYFAICHKDFSQKNDLF
jgi:hypothetical protein